MAVLAIRKSLVDIHESRLPLILLIGACLNGFVVRLMESIGTPGAFSLTLGLSPFEVIAFCVAVDLYWISTPTYGPARPAGWLEVMTLALILVPSSAASWLAVVVYAGVQARAFTGAKRTGALLFLALGACALWSSVVLKAIGHSVTAAEAFVVGQLAALIRPDIIQSGNVIGNPEIHSLVLMTACTTANSLPLALLALAAVAIASGRLVRRRLIGAAGCLALLLASANIIRLTIMTLSGEAYAVAHGPIGSNIFDGLQTAAVLVLGYRASRT